MTPIFIHDKAQISGEIRDMQKWKIHGVSRGINLLADEKASL
jgi:hypothetical protein